MSGAPAGPARAPSRHGAMTGALSPVAARLMEHGCSRAAARAAEREGRRLRALSRRRDVEFATTLDAATCAPIGPTLTGRWSPETGHQVDLRPHLLRMREDHAYVQVHSHPTSASFSDKDAMLLLDNPPVRVTAVIALDGTWYLMSPVPGVIRADPRQEALRVWNAFRAEFIRLKPGYDERVDASELTQEEARRLLTHQAWVHIAEALGLRYDRIKPEEGS